MQKEKKNYSYNTLLQNILALNNLQKKMIDKCLKKKKKILYMVIAFAASRYVIIGVNECFDFGKKYYQWYHRLYKQLTK